MYWFYALEIQVEIANTLEQKKLIAKNICVVIPVYNKIDYIEACINSVLKQSYPPGNIIVVDDGSIDGSAEFLEENFKGQLHLIRQDNLGVSIARNNGIKSSKLKYAALLDADDQWEPTFLEEISQLIFHYEDCQVYATAYQLIYPDRVETPEYYGIDKDFRGKISNYFKHSMGDWSVLSSSSTVIRKSQLLKVGNFTPNLRLGEDTDLWCRLALISNIAFSNQPLAKYFCFNESSVTKTNIPDAELEYSKQLTSAFNSKKIPPEMVHDVKRFVAKGLQYLVREHAKRGNTRLASRFLFDKRLFFYFGNDTLKMLLAIIVPGAAYEFIKKNRISLQQK